MFVNTHPITTLSLNTESTYDWENNLWTVPINLGIGYRLTDNATVAIGYRGMGVDYTSAAFSPIDTITHGPVLGFEFRF